MIVCVSQNNSHTEDCVYLRSEQTQSTKNTQMLVISEDLSQRGFFCYIFLLFVSYFEAKYSSKYSKKKLISKLKIKKKIEKVASFIPIPRQVLGHPQHVQEILYIYEKNRKFNIASPA